MIHHWYLGNNTEGGREDRDDSMGDKRNILLGMGFPRGSQTELAKGSVRRRRLVSERCSLLPLTVLMNAGSFSDSACIYWCFPWARHCLCSRETVMEKTDKIPVLRDSIPAGPNRQ